MLRFLSDERVVYFLVGEHDDQDTTPVQIHIQQSSRFLGQQASRARYFSAVPMKYLKVNTIL